MVEFALVGPVAFLILLGTIVVSIVVVHQIQLTQAVRTSARGIALCSSATGSTTQTATLPDGSSCSNANVLAYINSQITQVDSNLSNQASVTVYCNGSVSGCANGSTPTGGTGSGAGSGDGTATATCASGYTVEVSVTYNQPLYVPLVGQFLGNGTTNTRPISAKGEATCEGH